MVVYKVLVKPGEVDRLVPLTIEYLDTVEKAIAVQPFWELIGS